MQGSVWVVVRVAEPQVPLAEPRAGVSVAMVVCYSSTHIVRILRPYAVLCFIGYPRHVS